MLRSKILFIYTYVKVKKLMQSTTKPSNATYEFIMKIG